ncbi:MarR family transcriptional regulator [Tenacibaculum ovolyticum]|uniref:MarR family winged helix-turn-helix transcriptional regulator n=1 Tax=Tenacibaculum ovolyticum TaxID=104270 RepID=UPI001EEE278F|nr:MarR family transcriptional regulator [Tenacibaculum ovolyticum]WBX74928.1 MarR family transcriptional regulator [Tenacibaculum ovolyticum]
MEINDINKIIDFNKRYTRLIGMLQTSFLDSNYSFTEAHILSELSFHPNSSATVINEQLNLDEGYLSRVVKKLKNESLITKTQSSQDKRIYLLSLTEKGEKVYKKLNKLSAELVLSSTEHLDEIERKELANLLERVKDLILK